MLRGKRVPLPDLFLVFALTIGGFLRALWAVEVDAAHHYSDAQWFVGLALNLTDGAGYTFDGFTATAFWPVGYPATLALLTELAGDVRLAGELLNIGAGLVVIFLTYLLGLRLYSLGVARVAALIMALLPSQIFATSLLISDILFTAALMLALLLIVLAMDQREMSNPTRPAFGTPPTVPLASVTALILDVPRGLLALLILTLGAVGAFLLRQGDRRGLLWLLAGIVLGYAVLIRPAAWLLFALAAGWLIGTAITELRRDKRPVADTWRLSGARHAVLLSFGLTVLCLPWVVRNWDEIGPGANLSTNAGINLLAGNHEGANGCSSWNAEQHDYLWKLPEVRRDREATLEAFNFVLGHPREALGLLPKKFNCTWGNDSVAIADNGEGLRDSLTPKQRDRWDGVASWYYYGLMALAVAAVPVWSRRSPRHLLLLALVLLTAAYYLVFLGSERYRAPIMPIFAIWAACGLAFLGSLRRTKLPRREVWGDDLDDG